MVEWCRAIVESSRVIHIFTPFAYQYFHSRERYILHRHGYFTADKWCQVNPIIFGMHQHTSWRHVFSMWVVSAQRVSELLLYRVSRRKPPSQFLQAICWNNWKPFCIGKTCTFTWRGRRKGRKRKGWRIHSFIPTIHIPLPSPPLPRFSLPPSSPPFLLGMGWIDEQMHRQWSININKWDTNQTSSRRSLGPVLLLLWGLHIALIPHTPVSQQVPMGQRCTHPDEMPWDGSFPQATARYWEDVPGKHTYAKPPRSSVEHCQCK